MLIVGLLKEPSTTAAVKAAPPLKAASAPFSTSSGAMKNPHWK
jgi:hypothetical protein